MQLAHEHFKEEGHYPSASEVCKLSGRRKVTVVDEAIERNILDIDSFFDSERPKETKHIVFRALKYRWGFFDREIHRLKESAPKYNITLESLLLAEVSLISRLGFHVKITATNRNRWMRL